MRKKGGGAKIHQGGKPTRGRAPGRNGRCRPPSDLWVSYEAMWVPIGSIKPSPENSDIYGEVVDNEHMDNLVGSIRNRGLSEPILISADGFILSGHRRFHACRRLGWTHVPVRRSDTRRDGNNQYHQELIEYNPQRVKTPGSLLREALLRDNDAADTYEAIRERREAAMTVDAEFMEVDGAKDIVRISDRRLPFLEAVQAVIENLNDFWPLSIRQIHYRLLNDPPLKQKPKRSKFDAEHLPLQERLRILQFARRPAAERPLPRAGVDDLHRRSDPTTEDMERVRVCLAIRAAGGRPVPRGLPPRPATGPTAPY